MKERGSAFSGLTIAVLIVLVIGGITVTALFSTADKVDNKMQTTAQATAEDFVNEACSKGAAYEEDFNKMLQEITTGLGNYTAEIEVIQVGESQEKKTQVTTNKRVGNNETTIYYTSQVEDYWEKNNKKFPLNEGDQVHVKVLTSSSALNQDGDAYKAIADATATCTTNGNK